jgi:hypothetical protein
MIRRGKFPLASAQQFTGHISQSMDPESKILFYLKKA